MKPNLDIDVGNSRIKWRVRRGTEIVLRGALAHQDFSLDLIGWELSELDRINLSCVAGSNWVARLSKDVELVPGLTLFVAHTGSQFGRLKSVYQEPSRLGVDRWLAMIGAAAKFSEAFCVVSCGTAITIDYVNESGQHEGGFIIPGLRLQREALHIGTEGVRTDDLAGEFKLGTSTTTCALNGILMSLVGGVASILTSKSDRARYSHVFTGGDAELFASNMSFPCFIEKDLVMDGLAIMADAAG